MKVTTERFNTVSHYFFEHSGKFKNGGAKYYRIIIIYKQKMPEPIFTFP